MSSARQVSITANELTQFLALQLKLLAQTDQPRLVAPVMLWGPPGVGKSTIVRELCQKEGIGFIDIRLAQREPVDIRGLPVVRDDHVDWLLSGEWPRDPDSRGIILFDELTAADRSLQVAAYEIILDRRLGDLYQLPAGWLVMAAGNRSNDRAVAYTMSSALANRFCHLELTADLQSWTLWARQQGIDEALIAFLRYQPQCFMDMENDLERGWPSPRSWERVSFYLQQHTALNETLLQKIICGLVGPGAAYQLIAFLNARAELPDVQLMLNGKIPIQIPERPDMLFAFCSSLSQQLWQSPTMMETRIGRFLDIGVAMTSDFATLTLIDSIQHTNNDEVQRRSELLLGHKKFVQWSDKHGQHFDALQGATLLTDAPV
ncbi:MoxR family ATPase [Rheinheimera sp. UJ51]|uniref:ATP-binding protein n=1 Tax=Rheinheimera sp. UJ51 TaxID=2892446 RepID=UPI001E3448E5|nr:MoxR family ATPase [Rheinheimera sp. UJ51]MCC5451811.1 MoxR family ATPase [Rheinheimera sp. UJ51]